MTDRLAPVLRSLLCLPLNLKQELLHWVAPPCCDLCGRRREETALLCTRCMAELCPVPSPVCLRCGHPLPVAEAHCPNCEGLALHYDSARAAFLNKGPSHRLVLKLKYERALHLAPLFALKLLPLLKQEREQAGNAPLVLICVPQSLRRHLKRSYNQSEEMARELSRLSGSRFASVLKRTGSAPSQTSLTRRKRLSANKHTISLRSRHQRRAEWERARFVVIDDVLTTGATLNECARALKQAYPACSVSGLAFARSEKEGI